MPKWVYAIHVILFLVIIIHEEILFILFNTQVNCMTTFLFCKYPYHMCYVIFSFCIDRHLIIDRVYVMHER